MNKSNNSIIKGLAFDLGRVLFDFDYQKFLSKIEDKIKISTHEIMDFLYHDRFVEDFEKGLIFAEDFYKIFKDKTRLALNYEDFIPLWCDIFTLNSGTLSLIKCLKPLYKVFLISNINRVHFQFLKQGYPDIFSLFDEQILSFELKCTKPSKKIYDRLVSKSGLSRNELVYIDDRVDLIEEAKKQSLNCITFKDIEQCKKELLKFGVYILSCDETDTFNRLKEFLSFKDSALLGLGNRLRQDDALGPGLIDSLKEKVNLRLFNSGLSPENISLKEYRQAKKLLVIDSSKVLDGTFNVASLDEVLSLNPLSTHTSLIFFDFLKKELNLDILFLLVKAESFEVKEELTDCVAFSKQILEQFFLRNFSKIV